MTIQEVKKYSQRLILKGTSILLGILIFIYMFVETRGDFANGILFFLSGLFNTYCLLGFFLLFFFSSFWSKKACDEIIIERQSVFIVAAKYSILISLIIALYIMIVAILNRSLYSSAEIGELLKTSFIPMFLRILFFIFFIWFWATNKLKKHA